MRNVRVQLAYDGSRFFGWQRQDGFESVQAAIEEGLQSLLGQTITVHGAGRTDTGVHALGQVASFHVDTRLDDDRLMHALNAHLAPGVVVRRLETCADDFHARFSARGKRYLYRVVTARFRPPFAPELYHWVRDPLDLAAMRRAAAHLRGRRDFSALANAGSPRASNVRNLTAVHIFARRAGFGIVCRADGFLYNMVRTIAGTLIDVGRGKLGADELPAILSSGDRKQAGPTAPASGLVLVSVQYDDPAFRGRHGGPSGYPGLFQYGPEGAGPRA
ncbi:MAG: tRNA pseudouridine(38-40) synthase TruA [Planctomycetota bacterium]